MMLFNHIYKLINVKSAIFFFNSNASIWITYKELKENSKRALQIMMMMTMIRIIYVMKMKHRITLKKKVWISFILKQCCIILLYLLNLMQIGVVNTVVLVILIVIVIVVQVKIKKQCWLHLAHACLKALR